MFLTLHQPMTKNQIWNTNCVVFTFQKQLRQPCLVSFLNCDNNKKLKQRNLVFGFQSPVDAMNERYDDSKLLSHYVEIQIYLFVLSLFGWLLWKYTLFLVILLQSSLRLLINKLYFSITWPICLDSWSVLLFRKKTLRKHG